MSAVAFHDEGLALWRAGRFDDALDRLGRAVDQEPETALFHASFGVVLAALKQDAAAAAAWRTALALDPAEPHAPVNLANASRSDAPAGARCLYRRVLAHRPAEVSALGNLGALEEREGRIAEALRLYRQALVLDPAIGELWLNLGTARHRQGSLAQAENDLDRAVSLDPSSAEARWNRAVTRLLRGDYARGLVDHEWRCRRAGVVDPDFHLPRWQGEPLAGRRLLVWGEQGYGDNIQFARLAAKVRTTGATVTLVCRQRLKRLFRSLAGVDEVVAFDEASAPADFEVPLMSLPLLLGLEPETMAADRPYLAADPDDVDRWRALLPAGGVRVGIVWAGNPEHSQNHVRSLPLAALAPLWKLPGIRFISLQHDGEPDDLPAWRPPRPAVDLAEAAAMIQGLDLVISADTAIAHLAGALGKPVWILLAAVPDWRWGMSGETTPWYAGARLFRQQTPGDWDGAIGRLRVALERWRDARAHAGAG